ncbi:cytochrome c550 [Pueribacillus sp. YX66]|uniref:cytochrome c550 n=1 Tax=Pueribacillus sp. YX66 TaxID=3229242 RepID=UPI00358D2FD8
MTRNPVIPYLIIGIAGILLVIILSSVGITQMNKEAGGGEEELASPEEIYEQNCASCHGGNLEGNSAPALDKVGSSLSEEEIADIIQNGKGAGMPAGLVTGEAQQLLSEWLAEHK